MIQASPPLASSPLDPTPLAPAVAPSPEHAPPPALLSPPAVGAASKVPLKTMLGFAPAGLGGAASTAPLPAPAAAPAPDAPATPSAVPQVPASAGSAGSARPSLPMKTMLGFAPSSMPQPAAAPPEPEAPAAPPAVAQAGARPGFQKTMLGGAVFVPPTIPDVQPAAPPAAPAQQMPKGTMLGVAMPGIAPLRASEPAQPSGPYGAPAAPAPQSAGPVQAPQRARAPALGSTVALVAAPAPLEEVAAPSAPRIVKAKGVSLVTAALIMGGLVLVGGVTTALLWRQAPPISAQPKAAADGKDVLHLTCDPASCKDGTVATLGPVKATFAGGEADLPLAEPLRIGDNELALQIERPGLGRNEVVKMVVPVAFRVHADITTMTASRPSITIRVEALPGSDVRIDGKPVTLDANGTGSYVIDQSAATEGPADESRTIAVDVPYVVVPKGGKAQNGTVSARLAVAPLRVDAPGPRGVVEEDHVLVAGRAAKGASVAVDGAPVAVGPDGSFETSVPMSALGDRTVDVRGGTAALTPRTVHVALRRVQSLADEAKAFEAKKPIGYDAAMADLGGGDRAADDSRRRGVRVARLRSPHPRSAGRPPGLFHEGRVHRQGRHRARGEAHARRGPARLRRGDRQLPQRSRSDHSRDRGGLRAPVEEVSRSRRRLRTSGIGYAVLASGAVVAASGGAAVAQTVRAERPLTLVVGTPAGGARADRVDVARTGLSRTPLPEAHLRVAWRASVGALIEQPPLVDAHGATYVVGTRGEVVALAEDGTEKWHAATGAVLPGASALLSDDTFAFVDGLGDALGVREGRIRWRTHIGKVEAGNPAPLALDDGGLVAAAGRDLAAVDADGRERARTRLPEPVVQPLVAFGDRVIAITSSGAVWSWVPGAVDAVRTASFGTPTDGSAALSDEHTLIAVTGAGARLSAVDLREGTSTTRAVSTGALWLGPPATAAGITFFIARTPSTELALALDASGSEVGSAAIQSRVPAMAPDGGAQPLASAPHAPPIVDSSGVLVFATNGGALGAARRLRRADGVVELLTPVCSALSAGPSSAVAGIAPRGSGSVVVACRHGEVLSVSGSVAAARGESGDSAGQRL